MLTAVWGAEYRDDLDYLRAYIRYLRRKLERDPADPQLIVTVQGVGYMLALPAGSLIDRLGPEAANSESASRCHRLQRLFHAVFHLFASVSHAFFTSKML